MGGLLLGARHIWRKIGMAFCFDIPLGLGKENRMAVGNCRQRAAIWNGLIGYTIRP